ncbi:MAG: DNA polymerase III subunit alpha, partial [Oscillospiraceae bacterium]|nr:DNA polymerase III subunit alpha [Oscillospiraceae bacterium]
GALKNGVSNEIANDIFDEMSSFASYAFNKSHAAAYAMVAYQTAYLKCNYPKENMASLLTIVLDNTDKVIKYIAECEKLNIKFLPPHINESFSNFVVTDGAIRFGLSAIKNIGKSLIDDMVLERTNASKFTSFFDFCERMQQYGINKKNLECLVKSGALDGLSAKRSQMLRFIPVVLDSLSKRHSNFIDGQLDFFSLEQIDVPKFHIKMDDIPEFSEDELLHMEKEVSGLFLSGNPLSKYKNLAFMKEVAKISDIITDKQKYHDKANVMVLALVANTKTVITKNNEQMAFVKIEDDTAETELIIFPKVYRDVYPYIKDDKAVLISATVSRQEDEVKLISNKIELPENIKQVPSTQSTSKPGLYIKLSSKDDERYQKALNIISIFEGKTNVYAYFEDTKKLIRAPQNLYVDLNEPMIAELKSILGDRNVAVKK